ncbi:SH3 domain-containing protein [Rubellimicrobium rubrum]|nr:SH3 domain-containing protein [Rubellimicrobium rubrum]
MRTLLLVLAFLVLGWTYWTLSGGSDFRPEVQADAAAPEPAAVPEETAVEVVAATEPETPVPPQPQPAAAPEPEPEPNLDDITAVESTAAEELPPEPSQDQATEAPLPISAAEALAAIDSDLTAPSPDPALRVASSDVGGDQRRVTADRVNVRQGPGVDFGVIGQVDAGDMAAILEEDGGWVRVRTPNGAEGWMSARFLAGREG